MLPRNARLTGLLTAIACVALAACASGPPKPAKARLSIAATADVNPDSAGRPSPVVVRVYQLKDDAAFGNADFFAIFDKEEATLGGSLLGREEFVLAPGDEKTAEFAVSREAKFVGIAAAFRDIRNSEWRVVKPAPRKGLADIVKKDALSIVVEQSRVTLAIAD
jgi:type VI secretion system protein VasD